MPQKRACHFHGIPSSLAWFEYGEKEDGGGECGDQEVVTDEIEKQKACALKEEVICWNLLEMEEVHGRTNGCPNSLKGS